MALAKCKECGHQIAKSAPTCPNCGVKDPGKGPLDIKIGGCGGCLAIIVVIWVIASLGSMFESDDRRPASPCQRPHRCVDGSGRQQMSAKVAGRIRR